MTRASSVLGAIARLFRGAGASTTATVAPPHASAPSTPHAAQTGSTATLEITPPRPDELRIGYSPEMDGAPDAGEIVWTWVPYTENDGRGKDRPVLVIGRQDDQRVFAVRLTSRSHDGDRAFLAIGTGPWDARARASWVDIEQVYSVHAKGMRREASALDRARFTRVATALHGRYGWVVEN